MVPDSSLRPSSIGIFVAPKVQMSRDSKVTEGYLQNCFKMVGVIGVVG